MVIDDGNSANYNISTEKLSNSIIVNENEPKTLSMFFCKDQSDKIK